MWRCFQSTARKFDTHDEERRVPAKSGGSLVATRIAICQAIEYVRVLEILDGLDLMDCWAM